MALESALDFIKEKIDASPQVALVLGSGLGGFAADLEGVRVPYKDIPGFPVSTVEGHVGELLFTTLFDKKVVIMCGRFHFYEGYSLNDTTMPVKVFKRLGVEKIILTNAAGGINKDFRPGDLVLIKDHINFMGKNPLVGPNDNTLGTRFPDMSSVYNENMREKTLVAAKSLGIDMKQGVYVAVSGPSYETPAEIKMFEKLGADLVGMSTVPEAIVAKYCNMEVLGISLCTNCAAGVSETPLNHAEVVEAGKNASKKFTKLVREILKAI